MHGQITLGDIFSRYGEGYISNNHVSAGEKGLIRLLPSCSTQFMGSHFEKCDQCGYTGKAFNSCRNRHCPCCQHKDKLQWMEKRMQELLDVGYYHLVFTIPRELCLANKKVMYDILFKAASGTLLELTRDVRHLGAETGLISVLHTWGQNMCGHPHLHCIMPVGGLSFDKGHWVHVRDKNDFLVHYKVLSEKFLYLLKHAYSSGSLQLKGKLACLSGKKSFAVFLSKLYKKGWVVNIQAPLGNPAKVLEYLSWYVFRVAISDRRILDVKDGKITFSFKDYRTGLFRRMSLTTDEFIRRFLIHVLPKGFFKVRYYGVFSSRYRKENILMCKTILKQDLAIARQEALEDGCAIWQRQDTVWDEILLLIDGFRKPNCPVCKQGFLHFAGIVPGHLVKPG